MRAANVVLLFGLAACQPGCGQKGPLTLPDAQRPHRKLELPKAPPTVAPTPGEATTAEPAPEPAPAPR